MVVGHVHGADLTDVVGHHEAAVVQDTETAVGVTPVNVIVVTVRRVARGAPTRAAHVAVTEADPAVMTVSTTTAMRSNHK